jgi:YtxH-like protein
MKMKELKNLDADSLLGALGVQRRNSADWIAPAVCGLFVGAVVGVASALLLAPQSGEETRGELRRSFQETREFNPLPEAEPA